MSDKRPCRRVVFLGVLISVLAAYGAPLLAEPPPRSSVTSFAPATGRPEGGQVVIISGNGFRSPIRVLFRIGDLIKEAFVVSVTPTQVQIVTPAISLTPPAQAVDAQIDVLIQAGTANEIRATAQSPFHFQNARLIPAVTVISPASGPISGGTRVTVFGDGFQAPVQIFFGDAAAQVLSVTYNQMAAIAPASAVVGTVDLRIVNIGSSTSTTAAGVYRYFPNIGITAIGPISGPDSGGTRLKIDGLGFEDPLTVYVGDVAAVTDRVSATEIEAITAPRIDSRCSDYTGVVQVTNIDSGAWAAGPTFTYIVNRPRIVSIDPIIVQEGKQIRVRVSGHALPGRFAIGGIDVDPISATANPDDTTTFVLTVPAMFEFPNSAGSAALDSEGTRSAPISVDVAFANPKSTCTDRRTRGLTILPGGLFCHRPR